MTSNPIEHIRELKTTAKNLRDRGRPGYARALRALEEAIAVARAAIESAPSDEQAAPFAAELSDCFGLQGGVWRRWADDTSGTEREAHLLAAIRAYDTGFGLEGDPRYAIVNSYNLVNRLITRLMLRPDGLDADAPVALAEAPDLPALVLRAELERAATILHAQLAGPRRGDFWAVADLALIELVLGRRRAASAYADFIALSPPDFAWATATMALRLLAPLPLAAAQELQGALAVLEARATAR